MQHRFLHLMTLVSKVNYAAFSLSLSESEAISKENYKSMTLLYYMGSFSQKERRHCLTNLQGGIEREYYESFRLSVFA